VLTTPISPCNQHTAEKLDILGVKEQREGEWGCQKGISSVQAQTER